MKLPHSWCSVSRHASGGFKGANLEGLVFELAHTKLTQSWCSACRQASGGFKGSNRDSLIFELAHTKLILKQVVQAMQGVHGHATLHGDVKPDNFLVRYCYLSKA